MSGGRPGKGGGSGSGSDDLAARIKRALGEAAGGSGANPLDKPGPHRSGRRPGRDSGLAQAGGGKRPPLGIMTTTLWEYPSQHYNDSRGQRMQGDKGYVGATPSWIIWQLLQRYTRTGDLVFDPMCGSGTTLDVCADLDRRGRGFDLNPQRPEIERADARSLPMDSGVADFGFIDPPYSTHVDYSDDPACIGKLDAAEPPRGPSDVMGGAYYEAMEAVLREMHRVLKPGAYLGLYVSDSWEKKRGGRPGVGTFMPIGFELFSIMRRGFEPIDIISVVRHNAKLQRGNWHQAAEAGNFFLRGFNYLFIMKKPR